MSTPTPAQAALAALGNHSVKCPTCRALDDDGVNANLPCAEGDRLYDAYRQAQRANSIDLNAYGSPPTGRGMQEHVRSNDKEKAYDLEGSPPQHDRDGSWRWR